MGAIDYLALLEKLNLNAQGRDCINCTKDFTQFMQSLPLAQKDDFSSAEAQAVTPADERIEKMVAKLQGDPSLRYSMEVHTEVDPEAVILTVAIRGKGSCELRIPKAKYDPFLLMDLIDKHFFGVVQ